MAEIIFQQGFCQMLLIFFSSLSMPELKAAAQHFGSIGYPHGMLHTVTHLQFGSRADRFMTAAWIKALTHSSRERYNVPMMHKETEVTGVILVGGKSRRMGVDKAFLEIEGTPLFERVLGVFTDIFARTILIGSQSERFARYGLPCYPDIYPGSALGGLYTGLVHAEAPYIFVSACDVPFPSSAVARHLTLLRDGFDAVVAKGADGFEPLFAVYASSCSEPMQRLLEKGNFCIFDFYPEMNIRYVAAEEFVGLEGASRTFLNLNTPEEFDRVTRNGNVR